MYWNATAPQSFRHYMLQHHSTRRLDRCARLILTFSNTLNLIYANLTKLQQSCQPLFSTFFTKSCPMLTQSSTSRLERYIVYTDSVSKMLRSTSSYTKYQYPSPLHRLRYWHLILFNTCAADFAFILNT